MSYHTLTPRKSIASTERYSLMISPEDYAKTSRGEEWEARVTDQNTGIEYMVRGAACGLPRCFCDALATPVVEERAETIYHEVIFFTADGLGEDDIMTELENIRDDAERAIELMKTDDVELIDVFWDKHPTGYGLVFETTDVEIARENGFTEMLRPGDDEDEEDWETTPWVREADAYRALVKAVGEDAAKVIGDQVVAKYSTETERAEAYETAAKELTAKETA